MSGSDLVEPEMSFGSEGEKKEGWLRVEPETPCELNDISDRVDSESEYDSPKQK